MNNPEEKKRKENVDGNMTEGVLDRKQNETKIVVKSWPPRETVLRGIDFHEHGSMSWVCTHENTAVALAPTISVRSPVSSWFISRF